MFQELFKKSNPLLDSAEVERAKAERLRELIPIISSPSGRTDNRAATDFVTKHANRLRYVPTWHKWLVWDGMRWKLDTDCVSVTRMVRIYVESYWGLLEQCSSQLDPKEVGAVAGWIRSTNQISRIEAIVKLARCDQRIVIDHEHLNAQLSYFNLLNGTLDFDSGKFLPHNPQDNITQLANVSYDPNASCPKWLKALDIIFDGDSKLIHYCQQLLGYSCTGYCGEAILLVSWGNGANGKSTIWNLMIELLGDYGLAASDKLVTGQSREHATELANLYQRRFVAIAEPEENAQLQEARVKALTGDSKITARRMREDFWTFERTHKLWLATNHLPKVSGTDEGIWRRLKVIAFRVDLRQKVKSIPDYHKLLVREEGPGIVNWLLAGYQDYRTNCFIEPEAVKTATAEYRQASDELILFIDECLVVDTAGAITAKQAYSAYLSWKGADRQILSATKFGIELAKRFPKTKRKSGPLRDKVVYEGVKPACDGGQAK